MKTQRALQKNPGVFLGMVVFGVVVVLLVSGCETAKGFMRDVEKVKNLDDWFKERFW